MTVLKVTHCRGGSRSVDTADTPAPSWSQWGGRPSPPPAPAPTAGPTTHTTTHHHYTL